MPIITKLIFIVFCFFNVMYAHAEPSPFGIKIKETTLSDIKKQYKFTNTGVNKYSGGAMLDLETTQLNFEGLNRISLIFGQDDKVLAILTVINKTRYEELFDMLSSKYTLISKEDAFVGNRSAEFKDDNTKIVLNAPHLSFTLNLNYIHNNFYERYIEKSEKEQQEKTKQEKGKL